MWEPYTAVATSCRAPHGLSIICTQDSALFLTMVTLVYDIAVEPHCPDRVQRQFSCLQLYPLPSVFERVPRDMHRYMYVLVNSAFFCYAIHGRIFISVLSQVIETWSACLPYLAHQIDKLGERMGCGGRERRANSRTTHGGFVRRVPSVVLASDSQPNYVR